MRGVISIAAVALSACFLVGSCASPGSVAASNARSKSVIVEPEEFAKVIARPDARLVVLDARKLEDYGPAHAVGAQRLDMRDWTKASRDGEGLNDAAGWSVRIEALGIDEHSRVLVYDEGGMTSAARAWYILRQCGVADVRVVNGGWSNACPLLGPELVQAGYPGDTAPSRFAATSGAMGHVTTREELKQIAANRSHAVIDVRSPDEYAGKVDHTGGGRAGHVPGAANLPHKQLLDEHGKLRSPEELREMLASAGARPAEPVVLYCQSGGRAALGALAAAHAGYTDVSLYYMSMGEWLEDATCPVE